MRSVLAGAAAGAILALAYPPFHLAFLTIPAVALLLVAVRLAPRARTAVGAGAAFGLVFFGLLFPWLAELGLVALLPLLVVQSVFPTVYAGLLHRAGNRSAGRWMVAAAAGWGLMEWVRERFPLGGFGWGMLGYPAGEYAATRSAAQWIGTSGWSVVLAACGAGLAVLFCEDRSTVSVGRSSQNWVLPFAVLAVLAGLGAAFPNTPEGTPVKVAVVQGNTPCPGTHCPDERRLTFESHLALTRTLEPGAHDLVVWSESSTGFDADPIDNPEAGAAVAAEARRLGAVILLGTDRAAGEANFINANVVFGPDGAVVGEYRKVHPVPFGEYIPARPAFDWIPALEQVPRDMVRGDGPVVFEVGFGRFGSVISFESSFARYPRRDVLAGADLLVVATNQGSYPYSPASDQLIGMTRMRAAELGVDVVHAAVTGRSAIITSGGVVGEKTPLAEPAVLLGEVRMREAGHTLYARLGDWVPLVGAAALLAAVLWPRGATPPTRSVTNNDAIPVDSGDKTGSRGGAPLRPPVRRTARS